MAFDGIVTNSVIFEIQPLIVDSKIEKIQMPSKNEIIFIFHTPKEKMRLLISIDASNARFHITKKQKENPVKAPQFCMVLRKYLQSARLKRITQQGLDRVISFEFENYNELGDLTSYTLYVELMGKYSNLILVNNNNKILDSMRHVDASMSSIREVLPAREYILPTTLMKEEFLGMSYDQFIANLQVACMVPHFSEDNIAKFIANQFVGFSKTFVEQLLYQANIKDKFTKPNTQDMFNIINLVLYNNAQHQTHLKIYQNDYHIDLNDFSTTINPTIISDFLDDFYYEKERIHTLKTSKYNLSKDVEAFKNKYVKNLARVVEVINETPELEKYKLYGELISANIYRINLGMKEVTVEDYYNDNKPVTIPLNENYSPSRNSQTYFKKYSKLKNAITHSEQQKEEYEKNIDYLESVLFNIEESKSAEELEEIKVELAKAGYINHATGKKKYHDEEKLEPYKYEFDGVIILAGRNNLQNDNLTLKDSKKTFTWLHVKDFHGSHVIVQSDSPSEKVLEYAAKVAVEHSEAKDSSKVSVDYTLVKNVHKPSGSKPGKVIYTDYKTIVI